MALAFGNVFNLLTRRFVGADEVEGGMSSVVTRLGLLVEKVREGWLKSRGRVMGGLMGGGVDAPSLGPPSRKETMEGDVGGMDDEKGGGDG